MGLSLASVAEELRLLDDRRGQAKDPQSSSAGGLLVSVQKKPRERPTGPLKANLRTRKEPSKEISRAPSRWRNETLRPGQGSAQNLLKRSSSLGGQQGVEERLPGQQRHQFRRRTRFKPSPRFVLKPVPQGFFSILLVGKAFRQASGPAGAEHRCRREDRAGSRPQNNGGRDTKALRAVVRQFLAALFGGGVASSGRPAHP